MKKFVVPPSGGISRRRTPPPEGGTTNGFEGEIMFDLIFIAATVAFFLLSLAYVRGCEKLQ